MYHLELTPKFYELNSLSVIREASQVTLIWFVIIDLANTLPRDYAEIQQIPLINYFKPIPKFMKVALVQISDFIWISYVAMTANQYKKKCSAKLRNNTNS
jgi:hypothetical protein